MIKAVIFDLDGLLLDSEIVAFKVYEELGRRFGFELTLPEFMQDFCGRPLRACSKVNYMDVVSDTCAVVGIVVGAEYAQTLALTDGNLSYEGHKVIGDAVGILTDSAALVGTDGIEVTEKTNRPVLIGFEKVGKDDFDHKFGSTVGISGTACGHRLLERRNIITAVNGSRRAENDFLTAVLSHYITENECTCDIVIIIFERLLTAFTYSLEACEVDYCIDFFSLENFIETLFISDVALVEGNGLTAEICSSFQSFSFTVVEIVHHDYIVACFDKFDTSVGADISGAACNKN